MGHEVADVPAWVPLAYLIAGVCFILALRISQNVGLNADDVAHLADLEEEFFRDGDGRAIHLLPLPSRGFEAEPF